MKECKQISPTGLYMTWAYWVHVNNSSTYILCQNLSQVEGTWKYLRKKYKGKNLSVHRFSVIDNVDNQMKRRSMERLVMLSKAVKAE